MRLATHIYGYSIYFNIGQLNLADAPCRCEQCLSLYYIEGEFTPPLPIEEGLVFVEEQKKLRCDLLNQNIKHDPDGTLYTLHHPVFHSDKPIWERKRGGKYQRYFGRTKCYTNKEHTRYV